MLISNVKYKCKTCNHKVWIPIMRTSQGSFALNPHKFFPHIKKLFIFNPLTIEVFAEIIQSKNEKLIERGKTLLPNLFILSIAVAL